MLRNKMHGKEAIVIVIGTMLLGTSVLAGVDNVRDDTTVITVKYSFPKPVVERVRIGENVYDKLSMHGFSYSGKPGEPSLPARGAYILLPQKTKVSKIIVTPSEKVFLGSGYQIMPMGNSIPLSNINSFHSPVPDEEIYN
ncbi:MAG: hypothetical protein FE048_05075, partial [Thermoplasmata archaeon]